MSCALAFADNDVRPWLSQIDHHSVSGGKAGVDSADNPLLFIDHLWYDSRIRKNLTL